VQIGKGENARVVIGAFHVFGISGDGKELDGVCGIHHMKKCMCRLCLENRPSLFSSPSKRAEPRLDDIHENLAYERRQVDRRYLEGGGLRPNGDRKSYRGSAEDKRTVTAASNLSLSGSDNKLYELFYGFNGFGFGGLHASCWPDLLHVVQKGIVEKTLSHVLILVTGIEKLFPRSHGSAMSILDQRVAGMTPVWFSWMPRWVPFTNGLSQLLKIDSLDSKKKNQSTGLLSGSLFSWKYLSALFQAMICIGMRFVK